MSEARPAPPARRPPSARVPEPRRNAERPAHRLLAGWAETGRPAEADEHLRRYGELPHDLFGSRDGARRLIELTERAGLRGRGGAGFPTARKMTTVTAAATARRRPVIIADGCEGDPTSGKDRLLLRASPHLVLDGIALAAQAVGAEAAILCLHRGSALIDRLRDTIARRPDGAAQIEVVTTPRRYVSSEASALVNFLDTGDARTANTPVRAGERGVQDNPTLVDNVETLAHLALIARYGPRWFRSRGTPDSPGTTLVTVGVPVRRAGVYETDLGVRAGHLLRLAGGTTEPVQALLLGGLGGNWLPLPAAGNLALAHQECAAAGTDLGVTSVVALPARACGVSATAAILRHLAAEPVCRCGPCTSDLPAIAEDFTALTDRTADAGLTDRLRRRLRAIPGRGACAHPTGATQVAASALRVFAADVDAHQRGRACGGSTDAVPSVLRKPPAPGRGWR